MLNWLATGTEFRAVDEFRRLAIEAIAKNVIGIAPGPEVDALRLATDILNETTFSTHPSDIATRYDWAPRRLNPALSYLIARELIFHNHAMGSSPWIVSMVQKTAATRRFVKSRA